jgi:DNA-binding transcriptional LysR family regulator
MTLRELELFYLLSDNPHVSQLSQKIEISQSAISLAIKSLEKKLSEPLFDRIGKKLVLNERGRVFKQETYKHFLALKDAENIFKQDRLSGVIKIVSSKTIGNFIMPQLVYDFGMQNPNISIKKDIKNSAKIIEMVKDGEVDMGIIEAECDEENILKERLGEDALLVVSCDEAFAKKSYYIDQLFSKKWLLREEGSGTRELFLDSLEKLGEELEWGMEFTEFEEMKTVLLKNRETITCISKFAVEKELERGELFEVALINMQLRRSLYLIYHKDKYKTTLFKAFKKYIKQHFKTL